MACVVVSDSSGKECDAPLVVGIGAVEVLVVFQSVEGPVYVPDDTSVSDMDISVDVPVESRSEIVGWLEYPDVRTTLGEDPELHREVPLIGTEEEFVREYEVHKLEDGPHGVLEESSAVEEDVSSQEGMVEDKLLVGGVIKEVAMGRAEESK